MDTKKVLIFLAGAAVVYFIMNRPKAVASVPVPSSDPKDIEDCQRHLGFELQVMRLSAEAMEQYKKDFMARCLLNPGVVTGRDVNQLQDEDPNEYTGSRHTPLPLLADEGQMDASKYLDSMGAGTTY
jgi:hypothetical protein